MLLNNTSPLSTSHCERSETAAMGRSVLAATLVVMALLTVQLPAGMFVQNSCVNRDTCNPIIFYLRMLKMYLSYTESSCIIKILNVSKICDLLLSSNCGSAYSTIINL